MARARRSPKSTVTDIVQAESSGSINLKIPPLVPPYKGGRPAPRHQGRPIARRDQRDGEFNDFDVKMMRRALALARQAEGYVEPNPKVGCVIVRNGKVIGEGQHRKFGGPHAEVAALRACSGNPRGAEVYVTLEPCAHFGKTPPCVAALIEAGVRRVIFPFKDPNPLVQGRGARALRKAGIGVSSGLCVNDAAELMAPFLTRMLLGRPYVIAKWAQSIDGNLVGNVENRWISGEKSRHWVHDLRARVDAIMVGSGTVLRDDPQLTARDVRLKRRALRVVLDRRLRIPIDSKLARSAAKVPVLIFTEARRLNTRVARDLRRRGVEVIECPTKSKGLNTVLGTLAERGVTNLLVEGGPSVLTSFFRSGLVDEANVFVAPKILGPPQFGFPTAMKVLRSEAKGIGEDVLFRLRLTKPPMA